MKVKDKVTGRIFTVEMLSNGGSVLHLVNEDGGKCRKFKDEVVEVVEEEMTEER